MSEGSENPGNRPNQSWLHSHAGQQAIGALINPTRETQRAIGLNRERNEPIELETVNTTITEGNVEIQREYTFDFDASLISGNVDEIPRLAHSRTTSRTTFTTAHSEEILTSYESSIFDPRELQGESTMTSPQETHAHTTDGGNEPLSRQIDMDGNVTVIAAGTQGNAEVRDIGTIVDVINELRVQLQVTQAHFHTQLLNMQERVNAQLADMQPRRQENRNMIPHATLDNEAPQRVTETDVSYGQGPTDIRNRSIQVTNYMQLKEARGLIPEIDGTMPNKVQEFLSVTAYAMESINPTDEPQLLKAILCTKLKGKAMIDFQTRNIRTFEELKREIEICYTTKKSITHLQLEFNTLKQKQGEGAQAYGARVDQLAMKLYESTVEGKNHTVAEKNTIKTTIQGQALQNFQIGLHEEIKTIVRSRNYRNLQEAIAVAASEEKMKGPNVSFNKPTYKNNNTARDKIMQCMKCGKWGHIGRDCRASKFANPSRYALPKADGHKINALEKYCKHCKKPGHFREECWLLNGRPEKKGKSGENAREKATKNRNKHEESDEENDTRAKSAARSAKTLQVAHTDKSSRTNSNLDSIRIPIQEVKEEALTFLVDTGATLTLIKLKYLKGETLIYDEKTTLVGATGKKTDTLGVIKARIPLRGKIIKQKMHVVGDEFPITHQGILGADFLKKHVTHWDYPANQLKIGETTFRLFPCNKIALAPRSETIIEASTSKNIVGMIQATEPQPGVFIGRCIVEASDYHCPISVIKQQIKRWKYKRLTYTSKSK